MIEIRRNPEKVAAARNARLDRARKAAVAEVNRIVGGIRARYITVAPGQEMIYLSKEAEARRCLADPMPDPADYPLLSTEVGITAQKLPDVAQVVLNTAHIWRLTAASLEGRRLSTIAAIDAAPDQSAINAIIAFLRTWDF